MEPEQAIIRSICVFCSSSPNLAPHYYELARSLGTELARHGYRLVYGAGNVGMMGELARAVHSSGGRIFGVIPHALDRFEVTYSDCDQLIYTETMRQRKAIMEENADAFIALPGGIGTFEEILEIITLKQLGYHEKPIVLLNAFQYFDALLAQLERAIAEQFMKAETLELIHVCESVEAALAYIGGIFQPEVSEESISDKAIQQLE